MQAQEDRSTKWRGWLAKKAKRLGVSVAIALVLALGVRVAVAEVFYAPTDAVAQEVPRNARVLVYKLGGMPRAKDIVVYRTNGAAMLGRVVSVDAQNVVVSRAGSANVTVPVRDVVGRVVLSTR